MKGLFAAGLAGWFVFSPLTKFFGSVRAQIRQYRVVKRLTKVFYYNLLNNLVLWCLNDNLNFVLFDTMN